MSFFGKKEQRQSMKENIPKFNLTKIKHFSSEKDIAEKMKIQAITY